MSAHTSNPTTTRIITGHGADIMFALLSAKNARAMVRDGEATVREAEARLAAHDVEPEPWMVAAFPAFWSAECRAERRAHDEWRLGLARNALERDRERLAAVLERDELARDVEAAERRILEAAE